ncbi:unnamed protein product [Trichobilharzia szidati]|nr:unnamed protein product [Trichobilharzia szidati]
MSGNRTPSNHDDNGNNEDNYQAGESSKHEVPKNTKYREDSQTHTVIVDNSGSKAANYVIPLPSHAFKHFTTRSTTRGKAINQPTSGVDNGGRGGGGDVTRKSVTSKILNAAMVAHLHQLEVRNQKLEKEKTSLENQLAHILKRLRTDEINDADKSTSKDQCSVTGTDSENRLQTLLLKKKTDEEKNTNQVDNKFTLKYAPLACYDCMNDRQSLLESNSSFSLGEYSSLSDAYEEICLNKNPVDDINGSDLSEMFAEHNKTLIHDTEVSANNTFSKQSTYTDSNMNQSQNNNQRQPQPSQPERSTILPEVVNRSERRLESDKDLLFKPDDLLIYRPDEDEEDNSSESQYNNSSITSSSDLDIPTHRTIASRKHQFIASRDEKLSSSLSIVSYNSSTDSMILKGHHFEDNLPRYNAKSSKPYSTSLPVSPVILPTRWISKGSFTKPDNYTKMYKLEGLCNPPTATQSSLNPDRDTVQSQSHPTRQSINRVNSFNLSVSDNSDVYSLTIGSNTPQSQRRMGRNFNKVPPKVHISRKHLYQPNDNQHFSDTSSSINQTDRNEDVSLKYFPSRKNLQPIYSNTNRSNQSVINQAELVEQVNQSKIYFPSAPPPPSSSSLPLQGTSVMNQPPFSVPVNNLGRKQLAITLQQERLPLTRLKMGSINDFLNNNLQSSFHTNLKYILVNNKDLLTLKYLLNFIKFFEVFTCVSGFAYLLQNIKLNITNLLPILQISENTTSHEQLSSTNSESSLKRAIDINKLLISSNKAIDHQSPLSNLIPLRPLSNELYNSEVNTPEANRITTSEDTYAFSNIPDESKLIISENHAGVLLKLNNHLKIWHYYWCILTLKGLFLHQYQQTGFSQLSSLNQPKKVILFSDIHYLRRSTNMSTSINQLGCSNLIKIDSSISLSSSTTVTTKGANVSQRPNVSAPVSRKFMHTDSFQKCRVEKYFELVLHNKKVYRLRGIDSQQTIKWINLIKDIQRINEADRILNENRSQITKEGWLKRIKRGHVSWFWCKLAGVYLIYSLSPKSTLPVGCKTLKDAYVQMIGNRSTISVESNGNKKSDGLLKLSTDQYDSGQLLTSSSDSDSLLLSLTYSKVNQDEQQTIKIWTPDHEPVYLICPTLQECEQWRDSLLRASILHSNPSTFINSIQKSSTANLLENIQKIWKHLVNPIHLNGLYHSNVSIKQPISKTTPNDNHSVISLRLFDHLLFLCHPQVNLIDNSNSQSIEIPISNLINCSQWLTLKHLIMKQIINFCFKYPLLKDELYLQLIKQAIFAGINTKQISKDAYQLLLKSKTTLKHSLTSLLLCTKNQNFSDTTYSINNTNNQQMKFYENLKQNNQNSYFQIGDQYRQSLSEVSSLLSSPSSTAKLIISQTNLNSNSSNKRPECWWPAIAIWECLCLFLTFILPSEPVIKCLEGLFNLHMNSVHIDSTGSVDKIDIADKMKSENNQLKMKFFTEICGYAAFCQDTLNRTKRYGGREYYPSALEVFTLSIRNPYTHVYPFSLPVYLPFGSNYEVVNFHGGSSIHDLQVQIIEKLQLNEVVFKNIVLFAIYLCLGQSVADCKQVYLNPNWKICDIISVYEQSTLQNLQSNQNNESNLIRLDQISVKLLFKIQTFTWKCMRNLEYKKSNIFLLNFIVHQLHAGVISSFYQIPMRGIDFIDLIAYLCRADYYDYTELQKRHEQITFSQLLENYLPLEWLPKNLTDSRLFIQIKLIILERWTQISKYSQPPKEYGTSNLNNKMNNKDDFKSNHENQINMATFYACLGYLKHLKSLFPYRFNCSAYIARVDNLPLVEENQLIWIVPQDDRINVLTGGNLLKFSNSQLSHPVIQSESKKIICVKSIAYRNVVAYGGQQNGVFFLVYSDFTLAKTHCKSTSRDFPDPDLISSQRRSNSLKGHNYYPSSSASSTSLSFCKGYGNYSQRMPPSRSKESKLLNKHQCMSLKKLKFFLTDMHSVIDLTNALTFLINARSKSSTT